MNALKVGVGMVAVLAAVGLWQKFAPEGGIRGVGGRLADTTGQEASAGGGGGFVEIPPPDGQPARGIVIFAPQNCPSDAAQRAEALAGYLASQRIPYSRSQSANFSTLATQEQASRVMSVMNGPVPVVFVNGRAKANPGPEEVLAEYRRGGR